MSRFIALHCGDESAALLANHPNAFLLLTQIAMRAKWRDCSITRLKAGQAFIGDWKEAGLHSEKSYRHAKQILSNCGLAAFRGASKGTIATLVDSSIFSITAEVRGGQTGGQTDSLGADKGRARGGQGATNHTDTQSTQSTQSTQTPLALELENSSSPERLDDSNSVIGGTIDAPIVSQGESLIAPQSFPSGNFNHSPEETPIVSPGEREGNPIKVIQRRKPKAEFPELPFSSPAFAEAWSDWQQHRTEKRKPITPLSAEKALMDLAKMGEARAIAAINHSIAHGWQGIFEPTGAAVPTAPATSPNVIMIAGRAFKA